METHEQNTRTWCSFMYSGNDVLEKSNYQFLANILLFKLLVGVIMMMLWFCFIICKFYDICHLNEVLFSKVCFVVICYLHCSFITDIMLSFMLLRFYCVITSQNINDFIVHPADESVYHVSLTLSLLNSYYLSDSCFTQNLVKGCWWI